MANFLAPLRQSFVNGPGGMRLTEDQIRARDLIARSLLQNATDTSPTAGGWASILAKGAAGLASNYQQTKADNAVNANAKAASDADSAFYSSLSGQLGGAPAGTASALPAPGAAQQLSSIAPGDPNDIQSQFLDTIKGTVTNPYGLAAIAATGKAESGYSPQNAGGTWNDGANNAGGIMSWNGPRLANLQKFAGGSNGTPQQQGQFFLQENPDLIAKLNNAKSVEEAQNLMNNAWAFKGYNQPGNPNAAHRLALASGYLPLFQGQGQQVASAAPQTASGAIQAQSPTGGYVDPQVVSYAGQDPATIAASLPTTPTAISPVAQALVAQSQDTSASALPLTDTLKGGRLGQPSITQQNFNDRMGGQTSPAFDPSMVQDYGTQAPQQPQAAPQGVDPSQAPAFSVPKPQLPPPPQPLNPAVIQALQNPNASPQTKQVAAALLNQYSTQKQSYQEQVMKAQQQQQTLQQRAAVAQQLGINPLLSTDEEAWKEALKTQSNGGGILNLGNGHLYNSRTKEFFSDPNGAAESTFRPANADEIKSFGTNGQIDTKTGRFYPVTPPQGTSLSVDPQTGAVSFNQGAGVKPLTEGQGKDAFFVTRMTGASPTLDASEKALTDLGQKSADALPGGLGNYLQSEEYQLAKGAGKDFVTAFLRKDSGAAISKEEEATYGNLLLPQPGDTQGVIAAKRQRRQVAVEAIKAGLPPAGIAASLRAIQAVPGADKPNIANAPNTTRSGVTWSVK